MLTDTVATKTGLLPNALSVLFAVAAMLSWAETCDTQG